MAASHFRFSYRGLSEGVFIGRHVWVGEETYITKKVTIPDDCVIGAKSVVTKRFEQSNVAIAGNPARIVRQNVEWIRNLTVMDKDSVYRRKYDEFVLRFERTEGAVGAPAGPAAD
jgi:serine acetyltransferase